MALNVAHAVADLSQINFGVWNAAIFASDALRQNYGIKTCLIVCEEGNSNASHISVPIIWAAKPNPEIAIDKLNSLGFSRSNTIIVTHGCWLKPTRLGYRLKKNGFKWIYTPHGMLEPWSLANHRFKKMVYFHLFEKRYYRIANLVRAVSKTEQINLQKLLKRQIQVIENGVLMPSLIAKPESNVRFLFMARLHFKKGVVPLVNAWSECMKEVNADLVIAGPNEGDLEKIKPHLNGNIKYAGPVYGADKEELLRQSHYFLLPSFSEGFPTSVVEAMSHGLIPLISKGCNFPEVFQNELGYCIEPNEESILIQLKFLKDKMFDRKLSKRNHDFIRENYSEEAIGRKLFEMYSQVLKDTA